MVEHLKDFSLLVNPDSGIRNRALRICADLDPLETLKHIEAMLFSEDREVRLIALSHVHFLPFDQVKELLFSFLGHEKEPDLIRKAGRVLIINPSKEIPQGLVELIEHSKPKKQEQLMKILNEVVDFLEKSGEIKESAADFLENLKVAYRRKKGAEAIVRLHKWLHSKDLEIRRKSVEKLLELRNLGFSEAGRVLEEFAQTEHDPEVLKLLDHLPPVENAIKEPETTQEVKSVGLVLPEVQAGTSQDSEKDKLTWLTSLDRRQMAASRQSIHILSANGSPQEKALVLRRLTDLGNSQDLPAVKKCLEDPVSSVVAAAVKTLEVLNIGADRGQKNVKQVILPVVGAAILSLSILGMLWSSGNGESPTTNSVVVISTSPRSHSAFSPGEIREVKGIVQMVFGDGVELRVFKPQSVIFAKWTTKSFSYRIDDVFRGKIKILGLEKDRWRAEVQSVY